LAWFWWALCVALIASGLLLEVLTPDFLSPPEKRPSTVLAVCSALLSLACPTVGALVISRRPENPIGWIFCGIGFLYGVRRFVLAYADYALLARPSLPGGEHAAWMFTWLRLSGLTVLVVFLLLLFPNGRLPSPRWRAVAWATISGAVMLALGDAFRFGPLLTYYYVYNPFGVVDPIGGVLPPYPLFETFSITGGTLLSASCLASIVLLVLRLRRARGDERRQLKWFAYAAVPAVVGLTVMLLAWTVERSALLFLDKTVLPMLRVAPDFMLKAILPMLRIDPNFGINPNFVLSAGDVRASRTEELRVDIAVEFLTMAALLVVPICTAVAMLKHRLYDTVSDVTRPEGVGPAVLRRAVRRLASTIPALRWTRILLTGAMVGLLPIAFPYFAVFVYVILYPIFGQGDADPEGHGVVDFVNGWGAYAFFLMTTILAAWQVARKADTRPALHGTLVGLVAVVANRVIMPSFDPSVTPGELPIYLALGLAGGWLGGVRGRTPLAGEVYSVSRRIGVAGDPTAVAAAIGEHLGGPDLHGITLWRVTSRDGGAEGTGSKPAQEFALWGSWSPRGEGAWHSDARFTEAEIPAMARLAERPSVVRTTDLPADERVALEQKGIDSVLLTPLLAPGDVRIGVLMAAFRKRRRFSRSTVRAYLTVGTQAALALENMRLVEEARQAGQQTGVLVERQRLAREIHDTLAQGFTGIVTNLAAAQMAQHPVAADAASTRHLEAAKHIARESLAEARRLVWALRPESLDHRSLSEALDRLAKDRFKDTGTEARVVATGTPRPLLPEVQVALFRTAQEALTNVRRHARASKVNVTLSYMDDRVVLDVVDNGVGFEPARPKNSVGIQDAGGFGLVAIRERIEQLGGTLRVESAPGEGTTLAAELPIAAQEADPRGPDARMPGTTESR
jgi:signal transduction histidine kinase